VQTNWIPTAVALGAVALNAALDAVLYRLGIWGIPLATASVNVVAAVVLLVLLRRRVGLEHVARTGGVVVRIAVAAVAAAAVAFVVWYGVDDWLGRSLGAQVVSMASALAGGALVYAGAARALRIRELETLLLLRSRRPDEA
jgi:putative peptidoglycan lipid II flippase